MSVNIEYCDPFSNDPHDIWMKLEHSGRYLFAGRFLKEHGCRTVIDIAAANGYGSLMLAENGIKVFAADRNRDYLDSEYFRRHKIETACFDVDMEEMSMHLPVADAVVCFETIEHLRFPFRFLDNITAQINEKGWLLLSFPNARFERFNEDGTNRDPYHLHVLDKDEVISHLNGLGYEIISVLGQPLCNEICSLQHDLKEAGEISAADVDNSFHYDMRSIKTLSRLLAYPCDIRADNSYSIIIIARKIS